MSSAVGGRNSRMSTPLIGSITVLIIVITTFLAYNSNKGLPWVPSQRLTVEVKDAANIVPGNEVRIGGTRVGIVEAEKPRRYPSGQITALLQLKLDQGTERIPVDTTVLIRARSLLGLKYVQLTPGTQKKTFAWGSAVPLKNSTPDPVEIDQLLNTFDDPTRVGLVQTIDAFGNTLIGRGSVIGKLLDDAGPLTQRIVPVAKILADQNDGLVPFLTALSRFTGELASAGSSTGGLFRDLDKTTGALARADSSLDSTLRIAPDALSSTARSLAVTRGAIAPHIQIARTLQPSFQNIADSASDLAASDVAGKAGFAGVPATATAFSKVLDQLDAVGKNAIVSRGLDGVTQFSKSSLPLVQSLSDAQRTCAYASTLFRNLASATSDGDILGNWLTVIPYLPVYEPNSEGLPATAPAAGAVLPPGAVAKNPSAQTIAGNATLHTNPTPVTGAGGVCQPGYETRGKFTDAPAQPITVGGGPTTPNAQIFRPAPPKGSPFLDQTTSEANAVGARR